MQKSVLGLIRIQSPHHLLKMKMLYKCNMQIECLNLYFNVSCFVVFFFLSPSLITNLLHSSDFRRKLWPRLWLFLKDCSCWNLKSLRCVKLQAFFCTCCSFSLSCDHFSQFNENHLQILIPRFYCCRLRTELRLIWKLSFGLTRPEVLQQDKPVYFLYFCLSM